MSYASNGKLDLDLRNSKTNTGSIPVRTSKNKAKHTKWKK